MSEKIQDALAAVNQKYDDTRTERCQIELVSASEEIYLLAGTVLDKDTLDRVTAELTEQFPGIVLDTGQIQVLRQPAPRHMVVTTPVTGLQAEPTFRSEMMDQLLIGSVVELISLTDYWAFVRLPDGYLGWVYKRYLQDAAPLESTHYISHPISQLREAPNDKAPVATRLVIGTAVCAMESSNGYRLVTTAGDIEGWLPADQLRDLAVIPNQPQQQRAQMVRDSLRFIGVPYNWGGITAYGFDCSGYVRLLHKLSGILIPRDADMQFAAGKPVESPFQPGDLLFFGSPGGHRHISHVGMSTGGWNIIHSSRPNNGVYEDNVETAGWLNDIFRGARTFIL